MITGSETGREQFALSPRVLLAVLLCLLLFAAAFTGFLFLHRATTYDISWERAVGGSGDTFRYYRPFGSGFIRYTKDGAEYIDKNGSVVWERSYQLNAPVCAAGKEYAVIADCGGSSLYIFSTEKETGSVTTLLPVVKAVPADNGVVYAVLSDDNAEFITAFRRDGTAIDLSVKSIMTGDGYPFDISVSPDGTQLLTSYASVGSMVLENKVIFRNFGEIGQNADARRIVGGFSEEFEGHMAGKVHFSTDEYSQAFYDGGIVFFSTRVLNSPEVIAKAVFEEPMRSVAASEKYAAVVVQNDDPEKPFRLDVYDLRGRRLCQTPFDLRYTGFAISGGNVLLWDADTIEVYSPRGRLTARVELDDFTISDVTGSSLLRQLIVAGSSRVMKIQLK